MSPAERLASRIAEAQRPGDVPWHAWDGRDVLAALDANEDGLTVAEAGARLSRHGPNVLPRAKPDGPLTLLWRQINNPLIWVLIASGAVAVAADWHGEGLKNGLVILAVVILNSIIGFVQEYRAGRAIEALTRMMPESITARRAGRRIAVSVADLVPGDVIFVGSGDRVPADARLLHARGLHVEEAALTGESVPTQKTPEATPESAVLGDRLGMLYAGTLVTAGVGTAVVVGTGAATELGRISELLDQVTDLETPLTKALKSIGLWISVGIVVVAVVILAVGVARTVAETGVDLLTALRQTVIFAIALAVGAIPEGLPAIVTIALAIGVHRMSRRRAIVRLLPAVETLGSTTVICSDKTGTLTRNEMTVRSVWTSDGAAFDVEGVGYEPQGAFVRNGEPVAAPPPDVAHLLRAAALCSDASLAQHDGRWTIAGDPTEGALIVAARKVGDHEDALRAHYPRRDAIPFESERQYMATLHPNGDGGWMIVKGAPEVVLERCAGEAPEGGRRQLAALAGAGLRVLAVAERTGLIAERIDEHDVRDLRLLGLIGMIDPPRQEAIDAIAACRRAGIRVKMITGDHQATAAVIGRQLGLIDEGGNAVLGAALGAMDETELRRAAREESVFARVAPEHKLRLVRALQAEGEVVAMTGDGVNDAPALKQANIGVAMGVTGTSVAKEAAAVVLTDDNFASIAAAVEEGRRVYDNLVKSLAFVLPTNIGLALILVAAVAAFPFNAATGELLLPMLPVQLLWINLVAAVALALPLAFEAREPDVMSRPPRPPRAPILSRFIVYRTFMVAALMTIGALTVFLLLRRGLAEASPARAQTGAVTAVIFFQILYLLDCRSLRDSLLRIGLFSNPVLFIGVAVVLVLQALFVYLPPMQRLFGTAPLTPFDLLLCATVGAAAMPLIAIEKRLRRRTRPTAAGP
ncbi:MAG: HAD-IC family P-type ATPase [Phycisphaerales bacterium]|nr:HAD-IC family P-type ATPase [Phycisphaerales bacterium]